MKNFGVVFISNLIGKGIPFLIGNRVLAKFFNGLGKILNSFVNFLVYAFNIAVKILKEARKRLFVIRNKLFNGFNKLLILAYRLKKIGGDVVTVAFAKSYAYNAAALTVNVLACNGGFILNRCFFNVLYNRINLLDNIANSLKIKLRYGIRFPLP